MGKSKRVNISVPDEIYEFYQRRREEVGKGYTLYDAILEYNELKNEGTAKVEEKQKEEEDDVKVKLEGKPTEVALAKIVLDSMKQSKKDSNLPVPKEGDSLYTLYLLEQQKAELKQEIDEMKKALMEMVREKEEDELIKNFNKVLEATKEKLEDLEGKIEKLKAQSNAPPPPPPKEDKITMEDVKEIISAVGENNISRITNLLDRHLKLKEQHYEIMNTKYIMDILSSMDDKRLEKLREAVKVYRDVIGTLKGFIGEDEI